MKFLQNFWLGWKSMLNLQIYHVYKGNKNRTVKENWVKIKNLYLINIFIIVDVYVWLNHEKQNIQTCNIVYIVILFVN